ncbi:UNVERIFIED_CONTAM: hypothetical protein NCL1_16758 [Trichonephila clavipes]
MKIIGGHEEKKKKRLPPAPELGATWEDSSSDRSISRTSLLLRMRSSAISLGLRRSRRLLHFWSIFCKRLLIHWIDPERPLEDCGCGMVRSTADRLRSVEETQMNS